MRAAARVAGALARPGRARRRAFAPRRASPRRASTRAGAGARDDGDGGRRFVAPSEGATAALARALARVAREGDVICLRGDVGAGKSAFARAFTRAATGDDGLDVPSPTYLVQQRYDAREGSDGGRGMRVHHYDLYRLRDASEIEAMVDLEESAESAVSVLEWSERLGRLTPETRLEVRVRAIGAGERACGEVVDDSGETASEEGDEECDEEEEETDAAYVDVAARSFRFVGFGGDWADRIARISP